MATLTEDLIPMFNREINIPNNEQITGLTAPNKIGYIEDGFWDARLAGMLDSFSIFDGADIVPPGVAGKNYFADAGSATDDLPTQFHMLVVMTAGFRLLRLKIMELAVNFTAEAGPVSFEQQASATTLRALLASLERRLAELKHQYSDDFSTSFHYWDGEAQSAAADLAMLAELTVAT